MASDAEWERISRAAGPASMEISRFIVHRALMPDILPPEVARRAIRELLVLSRLEERCLREAGDGEAWDDVPRPAGGRERAGLTTGPTSRNHGPSHEQSDLPDRR